jgi:hypothetical protein
VEGGIMRKLVVFFIFAFSFGQVNPVRISDKACLSADKALDPIFAKEDLIAIPNQKAEPCNGVNWENEVIDTSYGYSHNFLFNSIALDTNNIPYVVYSKDEFRTVVFASHTDSGWQKEIIESGLKCYGFSLIIDDSNTTHLSYYRRNDSLDMTYHCYARRDTTGWYIQSVDSSAGYLGSYFWDITSSIVLDTAGLPSIAYIAWNIADSLHYIKYAQYNGISWDTSVVSYDSAWNGPAPPDWCPSLKFDSRSVPHIAFSRCHGTNDTLKYVVYDDSSNLWVTAHTIACYGTYPLSLALSGSDYPCIAYNHEGWLAYTWWDGLSWNTDYGIASIGWLHLRIRLDLDSLDRPHIIYLHWGYHSPKYCYKDGIWHQCGPIEPDTLCWTRDANIDLVLGSDDQPHVCYQFNIYEGGQDKMGIKYAKGTFEGIEEHKNDPQTRGFGLHVYPNPSRNSLNIRYVVSKQNTVEISIYDAIGARKKTVIHEAQPSGWYQEKLDIRNLANGVYFIVLKQGNDKVSKKFLLIK